MAAYSLIDVKHRLLSAEIRSHARYDRYAAYLHFVSKQICALRVKCCQIKDCVLQRNTPSIIFSRMYLNRWQRRPSERITRRYVFETTSNCGVMSDLITASGPFGRYGRLPHGSAAPSRGPRSAKETRARLGQQRKPVGAGLGSELSARLRDGGDHRSPL